MLFNGITGYLFGSQCTFLILWHDGDSNVMIEMCVSSSTSAWQLYDGSIELMTDDKQGALYL